MSTPTKSAPTNLADHLNETYRLKRLLGGWGSKCNLIELFIGAIKNGSLYLPPTGCTIGSVSFSDMGLCNGGDHYTFEFTVHLNVPDSDAEDAHTTTTSCYVNPPVSLIGPYVVETDYPYKHNPTHCRETMVFSYKQFVLNKWINEKRAALLGERIKAATNKRDTLSAEIKSLSKGLKGIVK